MKLIHPFTDSDLITIFELARVALADADIYDDMCEELDISDKSMGKLADKLQSYMDEK